MMPNNTSEDHVDRVLDSLNSINKVEASPYVYTRVMARLEGIHSSGWAKVTTILSRPAITFACVFMIILLNLFAVLSQTHRSSGTLTEAAYADDFAQVNNSYLDLENNKP